MSGINDAWQAARRARWMRPNAYLFIRPDAGRFVVPNPRKRLDDEKFGRKYRPDQPRVPAGRREGGQWTRDGDNGGTSPLLSLIAGASAGSGSDAFIATADSDGFVLSDANPDPVIPGAQYAQNVDRFDKTGSADIDRTTATLIDTLSRAHAVVGEGAGPVYGIMVHAAFATDLRGQNLPGIGTSGIEQSFSLGDIARYGLDGSIRTDVVMRDPNSPNSAPIAVWDVKTGDARLSAPRVQEILSHVGAGSIPVIELHIGRGGTIKTKGLRHLISVLIWRQ